MLPTNERPELRNYDPAFCRNTARWTAVTCVGWLTIAIAILVLVDPQNTRCPGWTFYSTNGQASSLWAVVAVLTAPATIWICYVAWRWERFSQQVYDNAAGVGPFSGRFGLHRPDLLTFPYNSVFLIVSVVFSVVCMAPLWFMLANCTNLPGYLGY